VSALGWVIFLAAIGIAVYIFREIDARSHSASDTLINFFFYLLVIGAVYSLIAWLTSQQSGRK
ncbi:MAG TPA: hypothetical protein VGR89_13535, partial [Puia sp.]|nr:hypothetical protein [Puia sp.]